MENKHTPGIAVILREDFGRAIIGFFEDGPRLCSMFQDTGAEESKANAARMVTCWNEHDHLTEQVKQLQEENKKLVAALADIYNEIYNDPNAIYATVLVKKIKRKILELDIPKKA